jgi:hypothetical protein
MLTLLEFIFKCSKPMVSTQIAKYQMLSFELSLDRRWDEASKGLFIVASRPELTNLR